MWRPVFRELRALPGSGASPFLFPSPAREGCMSNNTMLYALYRMGYHGRATVHGFRAMASTALNEMGFRPDVIERQLAHEEQNAVRAAYNRAEYLPERRAMMNHWADYLDTLAGRTAGFREGQAWRSMIWRILDVIEEFGLPATVAKPIKESQRPSPFVALVEEIQKQLPPVHWSFPKTHQALAAAIVNIRRQRREWIRRKEMITP